MDKVRFTYWQDEDMWLGYLEDYSDYVTQGETLAELEENLDICRELSGNILGRIKRIHQ
jgi:predicted RNase H-like HicB family nuclease